MLDYQHAGLQDVLGTPKAQWRQKRHYHQHASHESNRNQSGTNVAMMLFARCAGHAASCQQGRHAILPPRWPRNQLQSRRNYRRDAVIYKTFLACTRLIVGAKCNNTSMPATEPTGTNAEPTQECCYLHDFRHTRPSEPTQNQAEPSPEPAS